MKLDFPQFEEWFLSSMERLNQRQQFPIRRAGAVYPDRSASAYLPGAGVEGGLVIHIMGFCVWGPAQPKSARCFNRRMLSVSMADLAPVADYPGISSIRVGQNVVVPVCLSFRYRCCK
jgi:hypothetical protein